VSVGLAIGNFPKEGTVPGSPSVASSGAVDDTFAAQWARMPRIDLGVPANGAKVVVVKFNDFQCPPCGQTYGWYKPVLAKFEQTNPGAVRVVLKDWPWNAKCNIGATGGPTHPGACEAAAAYRMARDQGPAKELEMEEWLYGNQATLAPDTVKAAADRILGIKDFDRQYLVKLEDIKKDVADGMALHINGTPTLFINGVRVVSQGLMPAAYLELAIQLELNRAAGK
jgi:protein-disulfide isomerase